MEDGKDNVHGGKMAEEAKLKEGLIHWGKVKLETQRQ